MEANRLFDATGRVGLRKLRYGRLDPVAGNGRQSGQACRCARRRWLGRRRLRRLDHVPLDGCTRQKLRRARRGQGAGGSGRSGFCLRRRDTRTDQDGHRDQCGLDVAGVYRRTQPSRAAAPATARLVKAASASDNTSPLSAPGATAPENNAVAIELAAIAADKQVIAIAHALPNRIPNRHRDANARLRSLFRRPRQKNPQRAAGFDDGKTPVQAALRPARRSKNSAWLIAAFTASGWKGLVMRKAGSGRSPVSKRSG